MANTETQKRSKELIEVSDGMLARIYLVRTLEEIPEFSELWKRAREIAEVMANQFRPALEKYLASISPEGRDAYGLLEGIARDLYGGTAVQEARSVRMFIDVLQSHVAENLAEKGIQYNYEAELRSIVEPLGIPDLENTLMLLDMERWGFNQLARELTPQAGPYRDLLESTVLRDLSSLGPAELANMSKGNIKKQMERKVSSLTRHMAHYKLRQRLELWVANVIFGATHVEIAQELEANNDPSEESQNPYEWVRRQIPDMNRILGFKRVGRPPKGGVLDRWKRMLR